MIYMQGTVNGNTTIFNMDLKMCLTQALSNGTYSLCISSSSTNAADYSSKEGAHPPELVFTLGSAATNTSTPTPLPSLDIPSSSFTQNSSTEPQNPPVFGLVAVGLLIHTEIVITEIGLIAGEVVLAPMVPANPLLVVPLEIILVATSLAILDLDVAYWSYTYQVATNPQEHQEFEILPPWRGSE